MSAPTVPPTVSQTQLPLVIGVTGHRNLEQSDLAALRDKVRCIFAEIGRDFPQTPLLLLSALAEGADRLVAEVAQEQGIPVVAPLPMPRRLYETDFAGPSRQVFADWLDNKARCWFELPLVEDNTEAEIADHGAARNNQYAYVGEYIARHSQVLIALWDGQPGKVGGPQQVFDYKKDGFPILPGSPRGSRLASVEAALLYHVVTPRQGQARLVSALEVKKICTAEMEEVGRVRRLLPAATHDTFYRIFAPMERFNRDNERFAADLKALREQSRLYLLGDEKSTSVPPALAASVLSTPPNGAATLGLRPFVERYTLVDTLAIDFRGRMEWTLKILFALIFLAVFSFELCAHEVVEDKWPLLGYAILLALGYAWHQRARRQDDQNRYQDYRALAEGLRVQLFRRLAGLPEMLSPVADHYILKHATELDWIRNALRTWSSSWSFPEARGHITITDPLPADLPFVQQHWVEAQLGFFDRRSWGFRNTEEKRLRRKGLVVFLSVLVALAVFSAWWPLALVQDAVGWRVALLVATVLLLLTALMHEYIHQLGLAEHAKTYRRMAALFRRADELLEEHLKANDPAAAQEVIQQLGREALIENGDWLLLHRDRPMDVPQG